MTGQVGRRLAGSQEIGGGRRGRVRRRRVQGRELEDRPAPLEAHGALDVGPRIRPRLQQGGGEVGGGLDLAQAHVADDRRHARPAAGLGGGLEGLRVAAGFDHQDVRRRGHLGRRR